MNGGRDNCLPRHEHLSEEIPALALPSLEFHPLNETIRIPVEQRSPLLALFRHAFGRQRIGDSAFDFGIVRVNIQRRQAVVAARYANAQIGTPANERLNLFKRQRFFPKLIPMSVKMALRKWPLLAR